MSATICIVDHEPAILHLLSSILEDEGYQITVAQTGREALNVMQQEPPDVVILDTWIEDIDGLEFLKRVREQFPKVSVIMMSGHASVEIVVKAIKLGAYDYLEKPLDLEKVPMLVRDAMKERRASTMSEQSKKDRPNVFDYATKELSQDAMICWLLKWSEQQYQSTDEALHDCGGRFVRALLEKHNAPWPNEIQEIKIFQQDSSIDVLARIDGKQVLLIEDKTGTMDHSNQLKRYCEAVRNGDTQLLAVARKDLYPIYLKTGNQPLAADRRIETIENCNYKIFNREDFLNVLNGYAGHNSLLVDFRQHLQRLEDETNSYHDVKPSEWNHRQLEGFYIELEKRMTGAPRWNGPCWGYAANPAGGVLWFVFAVNRVQQTSHEMYLQIEDGSRLTVRLGGESIQPPLMHKMLGMLKDNAEHDNDIKIKKAGRFRGGETAAVATVTFGNEEGYRAVTPQGTVDMDETMRRLDHAQEFIAKVVASYTH